MLCRVTSSCRAIFCAVTGFGALAGPSLCVPAQAGPPTPQKMFAVGWGRSSQVTPFDGNPNPGDTIMFYDVTAVDSGSASGVFDNAPMFSVWLGYEQFFGEQNDQPLGLPNGNREEITALTFNPANGAVYVASFDSGTFAAADFVGDTQADYDLYRIDYQEILNDFATNSRPQGTIYGPGEMRISTLDSSFDQQGDEEFLRDISSPFWDGTVDGIVTVPVPHPEGLSRTVNLDNVITKVGEFGRTESNVVFSFAEGGATGFFVNNEIDFIDPETLLFLDTAKEETVADDYQIRVIERVSTDSGLATPPSSKNHNTDPLQEGGYNSSANAQSWESAIAGRLEMDPASRSNFAGWELVNQDGVLGVWVADTDGGGDDVSFFEIDLSDPNNPTATKKELFSSSGSPFPTGFAVDEDPSVDTTTNDGEVDFLQVDRDGNLVIGESGFFEDPQEEPRVMTVGISDYDSPDSDAMGGNEILPTGPAGTGFNDTTPWSAPQVIDVSANDNDAEITNTTVVAYDKGTGYIYIIDQDTGFTEDMYVFDPVTGTIVYSELNPFNIDLFAGGTQIVFTRGDITGNGVITYEDISTLADAIADPTQGGKYSSEVGQEFYDLTGDGLLTSADLDELATGILGTALGDFNLDGIVDGTDFLEWQRKLGSSLDAADLTDWQTNVGFTNMPPAVAATAAVPEPTSLLLCGLGLAIVSLTLRRL